MKNTLKLLCLSLTALLIASCSNTTNPSEQSGNNSQSNNSSQSDVSSSSSGEVGGQWNEEMQETMMGCLGIVLPYIQLDEASLEAGYSDYYESAGYGLYYIYDSSEVDLTTGYGDKLVQAGFTLVEDPDYGDYYTLTTEVGELTVYYGWAEAEGDEPAGNYINSYCPIYANPYTEQDMLDMKYVKQQGWPTELVATTLEGSGYTLQGVNLDGTWFVDSDTIVEDDGTTYLAAYLATKGDYLDAMDEKCIAAGLTFNTTWECYLGTLSDIEVDVYMTRGYTFIEIYGPTLGDEEQVDTVVLTDDTLTQSALKIKAGQSSYDHYRAQGVSGAIYDVYCAATYGIQLRSKNNDSGIVASLANGACKSITFTFNNNTYAGNEHIIDIYASNEPFTLIQMYSDAMTPIGNVAYEENNLTKTYTFTGNYSYIGFRMRANAAFFDSIQFVW